MWLALKRWKLYVALRWNGKVRECAHHLWLPPAGETHEVGKLDSGKPHIGTSHRKQIG